MAILSAYILGPLMIASLVPPSFVWWHLIIVFMSGLIGEGYGAVIGSGSVVTQFALISLGVPLRQTIAIDIAGSMGTSAGILAAESKVAWRNRKLVAIQGLPMLVGAGFGLAFLTDVPADAFRWFVIAALGITFVLAVRIRNTVPTGLDELGMSRRHHIAFFAAMVFLGAYSTGISVGVGTISRVIVLGILGIGFADSMAVGSAAILPVRLLALVVTALSGLIVWPYVLTLWVSSFIAGSTVMRLSRKVPERWLRLTLLAVTLVYLVYLIVH
jgi:uncharacterized membrane protein YfcA